MRSQSVEFLVYSLIHLSPLITGNISSSPLRSSWLISSTTSYIAQKEYKQKSYMELLVYLPTDFMCSMTNICRSPLWHWCSTSLSTPYNLNNSTSRSPLMRILIDFLLDVDTLVVRIIRGESSVNLLCYFLTDSKSYRHCLGSLQRFHGLPSPADSCKSFRGFPSTPQESR